MAAKRRHLFLIFSLSASLSNTTFAQTQPPGFISLPQYLAAVRAALYSDYADRQRFAVEGDAAFSVMRDHLLSQYQGVTATHSFMIGTQYVDCIPIMQQPSVRQLGITVLATPPPEPARQAAFPDPGAMVQPLLSLGLSDSFGNAMRCDEGTIPMRRVTLDDLSRFPTLRAFLAKSFPPPSAPSVTCNNYYRYAVGQNVAQPPFYGAQTTLAIWYPQINTSYGSYQHSLSQNVGGGRFRNAPPNGGGRLDGRPNPHRYECRHTLRLLDLE